ncbi:MAG: hypothetical protein HYY11_06825 [Candidatus Methylomirabilis oxyfera]|nr:hypothetical protein [Candidatus Methylomirabilis oxyfera]
MAENPEKGRRDPKNLVEPKHVEVRATEAIPEESPDIQVSLKRSATPITYDLAFWVAIRNSTNQIGFNPYMEWMDDVMCCIQDLPDKKLLKGRDFESRLPFPGVDAYNLLKVATEIFLMTNCGVEIDPTKVPMPFVTYDPVEEGRRFNRKVVAGDVEAWWKEYVVAVNGAHTLPYLELIRAKLKDIPIKSEEAASVANCYGVLQEKLSKPCFLELIWSYWHEEGMLVQTLNAISLRFQNKRGPVDRDPLAHLEIDPLRPLNNLLWGYIQDEQHRLSIVRRVYEYDHHYGLRLHGKAVPELRSADSRSKFLEAFHNLLHLCSIFFKEDDDTTVIADGFPVLNVLKEVHLLLTQGQHNQYGDLPWTARQEMLMQQWLLARPEMREFLTSRVMVAYPEPWMERVETMKKLQGWTDDSILHFRNLGVFGEQLLLSIRFGNWSEVIDRDQAANWARYWRPEIQGYTHAYRAVTGVDLTLTSEPVDFAMPSVHLRNRLAGQVRR